MVDTSSVNLTAILGAQRDRYAKRQGAFILSATVVVGGNVVSIWDFMRKLGGRMVRIIYVCQDGKVRDMIGRQGVHASAQDGEVSGIGHAMASADKLTLSFWTGTYGDKVNTGAGKGYRTIRAAGILAIRVDGADLLTDAGMEALRTAALPH